MKTIKEFTRDFLIDRHGHDDFIYLTMGDAAEIAERYAEYYFDVKVGSTKSNMRAQLLIMLADLATGQVSLSQTAIELSQWIEYNYDDLKPGEE